MLNKTFAVAALAASLGAVSIPPVLARSEAGPAASESAPWWDTNANAANSRANLKEALLTPSTVPKIIHLRSITAPPSKGCSSGVADPVLVGGDMYAITGDTLSKYNAATGALIWRKNPDPAYGTIYSAVALSGNTVIVGGYDCGSESAPNGYVFAYDATTGRHLWTNTDYVTAVDGAVISGSYVITQGTDGSGACEITVIHLSTGKNAWASQYCEAAASQFPLVVDGNVITTDPNGGMVAYNLATGTKVWSDPANGSAWYPQAGDSPGTNGKHLFATSPSGTVEGVNPATGAVEYTLRGAVKYEVLAVDASRVYTNCSGDNNQDLCAYNLGTGAREWDARYQVPGLAAEAGGVLYSYGTTLNAATGQAIRPGFAPSAIAVGDGRIAVVNDPRVLDLYGLPGY